MVIIINIFTFWISVSSTYFSYFFRTFWWVTFFVCATVRTYCLNIKQLHASATSLYFYIFIVRYCWFLRYTDGFIDWCSYCRKHPNWWNCSGFHNLGLKVVLKLFNLILGGPQHLYDVCLCVRHTCGQRVPRSGNASNQKLSSALGTLYIFNSEVVSCVTTRRISSIDDRVFHKCDEK